MSRRRLNPPLPDQDDDLDSQGSPELADDDDTQLPFYNTTYSTHKISPLYLGADGLSEARLGRLSQLLRDVLVGDVVRGVQVGLEGDDSALGRAGPLESVSIKLRTLGKLLETPLGEDRRPSVDLGSNENSAFTDDTLVEVGRKKALCIEIRHERAFSTATLLPLAETESKDAMKDAMRRSIRGISAQGATDPGPPQPKHFLHLPLLLLRMPVALRLVIIDFLATTFDCRISPLNIGTMSIVRIWEQWFRDASLSQTPHAVKDLVLTLSFHHSQDSSETARAGERANTGHGGDVQEAKERELGLKSIEVIVPADQLRRFHRVGAKPNTAGIGGAGTKRHGLTQGWEDDNIKRRKLAGGKVEEGWAWLSEDSSANKQPSQPFTNALAQYIKDHLALNMYHPAVRVSKIACDGFVISENRLKLFNPTQDRRDQLAEAVPKASWNILKRLVEKSAGKSLHTGIF
jgi:hypothetical protein